MKKDKIRSTHAIYQDKFQMNWLELPNKYIKRSHTVLKSKFMNSSFTWEWGKYRSNFEKD